MSERSEREVLDKLRLACTRMIQIIDTMSNPETDSSGVRNFGFPVAAAKLRALVLPKPLEAIIEKWEERSLEDYDPQLDLCLAELRTFIGGYKS